MKDLPTCKERTPLRCEQSPAPPRSAGPRNCLPPRRCQCRVLLERRRLQPAREYLRGVGSLLPVRQFLALGPTGRQLREAGRRHHQAHDVRRCGHGHHGRGRSTPERPTRPPGGRQRRRRPTGKQEAADHRGRESVEHLGGRTEPSGRGAGRRHHLRPPDRGEHPGPVLQQARVEGRRSAHHLHHGLGLADPSPPAGDRFGPDRHHLRGRVLGGGQLPVSPLVLGRRSRSAHPGLAPGRRSAVPADRLVPHRLHHPIGPDQ